MAKIQGITIGLSADATGIEQALSDVNKQANKTTKELGQINDALKFDPGNTTLLSQKFEVLQDTISNTSNKLDALKKAQADLDAQAASGKNIAPEQFRALAREIEKTEGMLRGFKNQAENVQVKLDVQTDTTGIEKMKAALKELGPSAKQAASEIGSALSTAGAAGTAAVTGLVVGMADTNKDLAMLETQIGQVGLALSDIGNARTAFESVGQQTDQVTEAVGNLIQAGYQTRDSIEQISASLAGAIVKYGDTFNVEGLAEAITSTTMLKESTGQLTDLLEKEGINVEDFNAKIQGMSTEQERANYISQLLADQGLTSMYNKYAEGNTEIVNASAAQVSMTDALSQLSVALTPLITTVSQFVTKVVEWANENQGLATALAIAGGAVTAITGAFALLGPVVSGVIALWPILVTAIGAISAPIAIAVAAIAAIGVAAVIVGKEMSESSIEIADWSSEVSESTAKAVGGFLELSDDATTALNQLAWSGAKVTQEMAADLIGIYDKMGKQVLKEMQSDHAEQLQEMTKYFSKSVALTEKEENEILAKMKQANADKEKSHQEAQKRIAEILNKAKDEKRAITEDEQKEINEIQQTMTENAIEYLTENEREQKVILENLKNEASEITAEQAAEVVKNSVKQKDEVVKEAQNQYDEVVAEIIKQRDETGTISEEQAEKLIAEAKKQRDETVSTAVDMHNKVVSEAQEQADEHVDKVNWETGEIKSKWQVLKDDVSKKMGDLGSNIKKGWDDALNWTKNKVTDIKQSAENKFNEMKTAVENKMSEVKKKIETKWKEAEKFLKNIKLSQIGKDIVDGLIDGIGKKFSGVKNKIEELAGLIPDWAKDILDIRSPSRVMAEIGRFVGDGLIVGMDQRSRAVANEAKRIASEIVSAFKGVENINVGFLSTFNANDKIAKAAEQYNDALKKENELLKDNAQIALQRTRAEEFRLSTAKTIEKELRALEGDKSYNARSQRKFLDELSKDYEVHYEKLMANVNKAEAEYVKEYEEITLQKFDAQKALVEELKALNAITLLDEEKLYAEMASMYATDTEQYKYFQDQSLAIRKQIKDELVSINDDYTSKIQEANEKLIADEETINQAYRDAVQSRAQSLYSFAGIFDEVTKGAEVSGEKLIENLRSQNEALKGFSQAISDLEARGFDSALLEELKALGPKSAAELEALNNLNDEQLQEYVNLWREKSTTATTIAEGQLVEMRTKSDEQIALLRSETAKQLDQYQDEWATAIQGVTGGTKSELEGLVEDMPGIGANVIQGMMQGLSQMTPALVSQAEEIANAIKTTIQSALDINSPSRVMRGFGVNIGEGLQLGMDDMISKVAQTSQKLSDAASNALGSLANSSIKSQSLNGSSSSTSIDNRKNFAPVVNVYTTESPENVMRRELKRMAFQF